MCVYIYATSCTLNRIKPMPSAVEVWSLNHWTAKEALGILYFIWHPYQGEKFLFVFQVLNQMTTSKSLQQFFWAVCFFLLYFYNPAYLYPLACVLFSL